MVSITSPTNTWKPWKPVIVKKVVPKRLVLGFTLLLSRREYSMPCPTRNMAPSAMVATSQARNAERLPRSRLLSASQTVRLLASRQAV